MQDAMFLSWKGKGMRQLLLALMLTGVSASALAGVSTQESMELVTPNQMPMKYVGYWCISEKGAERFEIYKRGKCGDSYLEIDVEGWTWHTNVDGEEGGCDITKIEKIKTAILVHSHCSGEGGSIDSQDAFQILGDELFMQHIWDEDGIQR